MSSEAIVATPRHAGDPVRITQFESYVNALLADLQNSVPNHQQHNHAHQQQQHQIQQQYQLQQQQQLNGVQPRESSAPGYGSLRPKPVPQSPLYQTLNHAQSPSPVFNSPSSQQSPHSRSGTPHNSLPRSQTPQHAPAGNLSELDSLLQDLSSARYGSSLDKSAVSPGGSSLYRNGAAPSPSPLNDAYKRPSVDSLLDELSNAGPIYAVPNGTSTPGVKSNPNGGKHVTITVRETKTERMTPVNPGVQQVHVQQQYSHQPTAQHHNQAIQQQQHVERQVVQQQHQQAPGAPFASSATKELDDLMASLSDFKINSSSHQHQSVTEFAKPTQGISYTEITTTTERTHQRDQLDSMLGNLQADMSRQGVTTTQKGCCNACDKPIVGQVITALGKTWHPEHFTCNHCSQELGTRNFFERDGHPYCEPDYHNLFSPRCAYCNGAILDKCVTALEKTWHTEHFFCAQCGQQFGEDGFHERDGKPYCRNDYFDMFAPKCNGCNRAIMENYISALNSQWHPDCFVCRDCKKAVRGKSFYAMEGKPVCPTCVGVDEEE